MDALQELVARSERAFLAHQNKEAFSISECALADTREKLQRARDNATRDQLIKLQKRILGNMVFTADVVFADHKYSNALEMYDSIITQLRYNAAQHEGAHSHEEDLQNLRDYPIPIAARMINNKGVCALHCGAPDLATRMFDDARAVSWDQTYTDPVFHQLLFNMVFDVSIDRTDQLRKTFLEYTEDIPAIFDTLCAQWPDIIMTPELHDTLRKELLR